jgi:hypothetical protein
MSSSLFHVVAKLAQVVGLWLSDIRVGSNASKEGHMDTTPLSVVGSSALPA